MEQYKSVKIAAGSKFSRGYFDLLFSYSLIQSRGFIFPASSPINSYILWGSLHRPIESQKPTDHCSNWEGFAPYLANTPICTRFNSSIANACTYSCSCSV